MDLSDVKWSQRCKNSFRMRLRLTSRTFYAYRISKLVAIFMPHCRSITLVTKIFLVNLSMADLLVTLFCMPMQIAKSATLLWYFGEVMCKAVNFLQGVAVASNVFTITAISVDRYLVISQFLRQPWMPSRRGACGLLVALWLISLAIFAVERKMILMPSRNVEWSQNGLVRGE